MTRLQFLISKKLSEGLSLREIARKSNVNHVSISQYYVDAVDPDHKNLQLLSKYFGVDPYDLLEHIDNKNNALIIPTRNIPVITKAQAGADGYWEDCYPCGAGLDMIPCPADITDPHAFAFLVDGDSMRPFARHGWKVIVDTTKVPVNGDEVIVKLSDGQVMLKIYRKINGIVLLESYNQSYEPIQVNTEDIVCCFLVVDARR